MTQGAADLAPFRKSRPVAQGETKASEAVTRFIAGVKATLGEQVSEVRASERLTESAVCLVAPESGLDRQLERILAGAGQFGSAAKPILELNPQPRAHCRSGEPRRGRADVAGRRRAPAPG